MYRQHSDGMPSSKGSRGSKKSGSKSSSSSSSSSSGPNKQNAALRTLVQRRFTKDVFEATATQNGRGWMVLVVDKAAMRVLSSSVGMYDVMEKQITVVEDLAKKRAPFRDMNVIYLIACAEDSVNRLIEDYTKKPLYGKAAYVFFLGRISERQLTKIKECRPLIKRLKGLAEVNVDFLTPEMRGFHMDLRGAFSPIYVRNRKSKIENRLADKLVTLCSTLNELPHVRFAESSPTASVLARTFHNRMENFARANPTFWYHGDPSHTDKERCTLLILDRKDDCLSPLMHDFTYQCMINDLLPIEEDLIKYVPDSGGNGYDDDDDDWDDDDESFDEENVGGRKKAEKETKAKNDNAVDVLLNENDAVWVELRGQHIAKVIEELSSRIREMVNGSTNSGFKSGGKSQMSLSQMASALKALPEYKEVMSKLSQHMYLAHQCMDQFNSQGLLVLSELEQTLATGKDEDGKSRKLSDLVSQVEKSLSRMRHGQDRLRLLLILIVSQGGIRSGDKDRLFRAARLSADQQKTLDNLTQYLDVPVFSEGGGESSTKKKYGFGNLFGESLNKAADVDEESEFANSRYVPPLKPVLTACVRNELSFDDYPSVVPMPQQVVASTSSANSAGTAHSARKTVAGSARKGGATNRWQKTTSPTKAPASAPNKAKYQGGRIIVFVVGGMSFSELRVTREVMQKESKEIVAGSTHFVSPQHFIEDIHHMA